MAPARPPLNVRVVMYNALQGCGEDTIDAYIHHYTKGISIISRLLVYDNCYAISCHYI